MLKIGEFARLAQVSVKTLRYYDRVGLLQPAAVDRFTSYRYYDPVQMARLNRILALKGLGFSLDQIRHLLREELTAGELRGMLRLWKTELAAEIDDARTRLAQVRARLAQIEHEDCPAGYDVITKPLAPIAGLALQQTIADYGELPSVIDRFAALAGLCHWYEDDALLITAICQGWSTADVSADVEIVAPLPVVDGLRVARAAGLVDTQIPGATRAACLLYEGAYIGLGAAYATLASWCDHMVQRVTAPHREVFLSGPWPLPPDEAQCVVELQLPIESLWARFSKDQQERIMNPDITERAPFTVVGMVHHGDSTEEIGQLWTKFNTRMRDDPNLFEPSIAYGVCFPPGPDGKFDYLAGMGASIDAQTPQGMVRRDVPGGRFAVFETALATIHEAYQYAYQTWLPASGHSRRDAPDYELYDTDFCGDDPQSTILIYIPID